MYSRGAFSLVSFSCKDMRQEAVNAIISIDTRNHDIADGKSVSGTGSLYESQACTDKVGQA
jgi:hypothetical protein